MANRGNSSQPGGSSMLRSQAPAFSKPRAQPRWLGHPPFQKDNPRKKISGRSPGHRLSMEEVMSSRRLQSSGGTREQDKQGEGGRQVFAVFMRFPCHSMFVHLFNKGKNCCRLSHKVSKKGFPGTGMQVTPGSGGLQDLSVSQLSSS